MATNLAEKSLIASMKARMPAMLVGPPGVGKTAKMYEIADRLGYELITLIGSQLDPTDLVGLPKGEMLGHTDEGKEIHGTVNLSPWWQVRILKDKKIILFLDEWSNTPAAVRASSLTMLQSREFPNGQKMPPETIVVGAMNPAEEAADGNDLDMPTTNRINFIVWAPSLNEWTTGMLNAWGKDVHEDEKFWRDRVVSFIKDNPGQLQIPPQEVNSPEAYGVDPNDASEMEVLRYAWPSRRSWDNLSRVLRYAKGDSAVEDTLAQGIIGYSAAAKLRDWLQRNSTITVHQLLKDPDGVNWRKLDVNEANSLLRSVVDLASTPEYSGPAIEVFESLADHEQYAYGAPFVKELLTACMGKTIPSEITAINKPKLLALVKRFKSVNDNMS